MASFSSNRINWGSPVNITSYSLPGNNGLSGFKTWECYMYIKYGNSTVGDTSSTYEYLIELPLYPEEVQESIAASWDTQSVLGRSASISAYANTDLKDVSFNLDLHRDLLTGSYSLTKTDMQKMGYSEANQAAGLQQEQTKGPYWTRTWYTNINKMLQISCYPQYTSSGLLPPTTYFVFGQMILKGYVRNYSTQWKKPILNTFFGWNTVGINMSCYPDTIVSAKNIMSDTGSASTQNTYNTPYPPKSIESSNVMALKATNDRSNARTVASLSSTGTLGGQVSDT